jgi:hypothetical protein
MEKPPSVGDEEKKRRKEQQKQMEKSKQREKEMLDKFKTKIQERVNLFIKDGTKEKQQFEPMDKICRAILHEVADVAGLTSFSFGQDEVDRYVMVWKKEFAPSDEELAAYRRGDEWDPEKAKQLAKQKELEKAEEMLHRQGGETAAPKSNYREKYEHLIGTSAAKDAAQSTTANKSYGFVPSENKRDLRTIEQVMADTRAKKKQKTEHTNENPGSDSPDHQSQS